MTQLGITHADAAFRWRARFVNAGFWVREAHLSPTHRSFHELRRYSHVPLLADTCDQLTFGALAALGVVSGLIQSIFDVHMMTEHADWSNALLHGESLTLLTQGNEAFDRGFHAVRGGGSHRKRDSYCEDAREVRAKEELQAPGADSKSKLDAHSKAAATLGAKTLAATKRAAAITSEVNETGYSLNWLAGLKDVPST